MASLSMLNLLMVPSMEDVRLVQMLLIFDAMVSEAVICFDAESSVLTLLISSFTSRAFSASWFHRSEPRSMVPLLSSLLMLLRVVRSSFRLAVEILPSTRSAAAAAVCMRLSSFSVFCISRVRLVYSFFSAVVREDTGFAAISLSRLRMVSRSAMRSLILRRALSSLTLSTMVVVWVLSAILWKGKNVLQMVIGQM